jgi:DNA-binding transcriptional LysR family regulator
MKATISHILDAGLVATALFSLPYALVLSAAPRLLAGDKHVRCTSYDGGLCN